MSKRAEAARRNARLGGLKTAQTHSKDFLEERARKAGEANLLSHGREFFGHIARKSRTTINRKKEQVIKTILPSGTLQTSSADLMQAATENI